MGKEYNYESDKPTEEPIVTAAKIIADALEKVASSNFSIADKFSDISTALDGIGHELSHIH